MPHRAEILLHDPWPVGLTWCMPYPQNVPVLTDGTVTLRAHDRNDAARIVEQGNDLEQVRWTTVPQPYGMAQAQEFLATIESDWNDPGATRYWAISAADDPTGSYRGTIDVRPTGAGIGEIGFGLHPRDRGRHLMSGALRLATHWWFDQGGVRMYWRANRGNFPSWRVAWACGFTFHGCLPEYLDGRGLAHDGWIASIGHDGDLHHPASRWNEAVPLAGEGIALRPWREDDVVPEEADHVPPHFMPPGAAPTSSTFAEWLLRRRERMALGLATHWCISDAEDDTALGEVLLIEATGQEGSVELGYQLFPWATGRGAATIACRLVLQYALAPVTAGGRGVCRVSALTVGDNEPSARVLTRLGFTQWGREPAFCSRADGTLDDARHWVLLTP